MNVTAIILDFGGIFVTWEESFGARLARAFSAPLEEMQAALWDVLPQVQKKDAPPLFTLFQPYLKKWRTHIDEGEFVRLLYLGTKVEPDVCAWVKGLRDAGLKTFILSTTFHERVEYYRRTAPEIFAAVDEAYSSCYTGVEKPDPRAWQQILEEWQLAPEEVIYFDNEDANIEAAEALGIKAIHWPGLENAKILVSSKLA